MALKSRNRKKVGELGRNPSHNLAALLQVKRLLQTESGNFGWRQPDSAPGPHLPPHPRASQALPTPLTTQEAPQVLVEPVPWGQRMGSCT